MSNRCRFFLCKNKDSLNFQSEKTWNRVWRDFFRFFFRNARNIHRENPPNFDQFVTISQGEDVQMEKIKVLAVGSQRYRFHPFFFKRPLELLPKSLPLTRTVTSKWGWTKNVDVRGSPNPHSWQHYFFGKCVQNLSPFFSGEMSRLRFPENGTEDPLHQRVFRCDPRICKEHRLQWKPSQDQDVFDVETQNLWEFYKSSVRRGWTNQL